MVGWLSGVSLAVEAPVSPKAAGKTNSPFAAFQTRPQAGLPVTNAHPAAPQAKGKAAAGTNTVGKTAGGTNTVTTSRATATTNAPSGLMQQWRQLQANPAFYPVVALVPLCLGAVFLLLAFKSKSKKAEERSPAALSSGAGAKVLKRRVSSAAIHSCNVLQVGSEGRKLWHFGARNGGFALSREQASSAGEALPTNLVIKDWRALWQPRLNIAWLPPQHVFLRVAQFPLSDFDETLAMVELQLEKLSPLPVTQIVWSIHTLAHPQGNMQTVVIMIVARNVVEEFLGQLETQGYMADRLELPLLDQLQATSRAGDGVWIYPAAAGGKDAALVAWYAGGVLHNLDLIILPVAHRAASVKEQLVQMAWAGELEGWLTSQPVWHLVADQETVGEWEPALREGLEQTIEVIPPLSSPELAALTATRAAHAGPEGNLLPLEFSTRYQQQFYDRLWMRGLGAVVMLYLICVAVYFVGLQYALFRVRGVEEQVANLGPAYTNAMQLKARFDILKDRQDLKYAALDCWRTTAELLPENVILDGFNFSDGKRLTLNGTAPSEDVSQLLEFEAAMRKAVVNGQPLFDPIKGNNLVYRANAGGGTVTWNFTLELKRAEAL